MLDPNTNKIVEYALPVKWSFPYDIQQDHDSNYWIADSGQGGGLIKFELKSKTFTYYPAEQRTDMPKIEVSNENSIWYTTRSGRFAGPGARRAVSRQDQDPNPSGKLLIRF